VKVHSLAVNGSGRDQLKVPGGFEKIKNTYLKEKKMITQLD